jgi:hypothetical protein
MCPLTANDYFGCCPHRHARRHDITGIAALVAHGPTVALLVEFRRIARRSLPLAGSGPDAIAIYCLPLTSNAMGGAEKACYWSFFDAKVQPVPTIKSGDVDHNRHHQLWS